MHPIERLRYVARDAYGDALATAEEAALALGSLGPSSPALLPSCRRLLQAHPACGPLWWVAARLLTASDIRAEALKLLDLLERDESVEELAGAIPSQVSVAAEATVPISGALEMRPDIEIRLVGSPSSLSGGLRSLGSEVDVSGWTIDEAADATSGVGLVVIEALIAGPEGFLASATGTVLADAARYRSLPLYVRLGVGCLLPQPLFDRALVLNGVADGSERSPSSPAESECDEERNFGREAITFLTESRASYIVSPRGVEAPYRALHRPTCAAPVELLA